MRKPAKLTQTMVDTMKLPAGKDEDVIADVAAPGLKFRIRREGARVIQLPSGSWPTISE